MITIEKRFEKEMEKLKGRNVRKVAVDTGISASTMWRMEHLIPNKIDLKLVSALERKGYIDLSNYGEKIAKLKAQEIEEKLSSEIIELWAQLSQAISLLTECKNDVLPQMKCTIEAYHAKDAWLGKVSDFMAQRPQRANVEATEVLS